MGMDVFHYKVIKVLTPDEVNNYYKNDPYNEAIVQLSVNERLLSWMKINDISPSQVVEVTEVDWEEWFIQNPEYKDYECIAWDLSPEVEPKWLELESPDGKTVLLGSGFLYKQVPYLFIRKEEVGYMRKPFRHSETPAKIENGSLVLNVTNFSDKGIDALDELEKIDPEQMEQANVFVFDYANLKALQENAYDSREFYRLLMEDWEKDHFVLFNW